MANNSPEQSARSRKSRIAKVVAAPLAASLLLGGCAPSEREQALEDARAARDSVKSARDLAQCSFQGIVEGPDISYQGKQSPTVALLYEVSPTDTVLNSPWLQDGGTKLGDGSRVEVAWHTKMNVQHTMSDGMKLPGVMVDKDQHDRDAGSTTGEHEALIPLNADHQGPRTIVPSIEVAGGLYAPGDEWKPLAEPKVPCGEIDVTVTGNTVTLNEVRDNDDARTVIWPVS